MSSVLRLVNITPTEKGFLARSRPTYPRLEHLLKMGLRETGCGNTTHWKPVKLDTFNFWRTHLLRPNLDEIRALATLKNNISLLIS
jgi:hypothetical protein